MKADQKVPVEPGIYDVELAGIKFRVTVSERLSVS